MIQTCVGHHPMLMMSADQPGSTELFRTPVYDVLALVPE
jgi:hypothetical protein